MPDDAPWRTTTSTSHIYVGDSDSDLVICKNLVFENLRPESTKPVVDIRRGVMHLEGCSIRQTTGTGPCALKVVTTDVAHKASAVLHDCSVYNGVSDESMYAIMAGCVDGYLEVKDSHVRGGSGIRLNGDFGNGIYEEFEAKIVHSRVAALHADGTAISSSASRDKCSATMLEPKANSTAKSRSPTESRLFSEILSKPN